MIDEIHMLIGAGTSFSSSLDAANILKPALADGSLRCIGMTTFKEYRNYFEKDKALSRRFQKIDVLEPSEKSCLKILQSLKKHYESFHDVIIEDNIFDEIIELSNKYLHERKMPDKVIDVLDESCALVKLNFSNIKNKIVNKNAVERAIALMTNSPSLHVEKSSKYLLENLSAILKKNIFGQDEAVESIVQAILLAYSDLKNINKPVANFLFMGPTGVGKTEIAKVLAKELNIKLIRFDMSEYMNTHDLSKLIGSAPGYVGYENGGLLTEKIQQNPYCVLLLDEIEKAHHDIFNILLQIMDYGKLTDSHGRSINFKDVIIIMTCNTDNTKNIGFITNKLKQNNKDNQCFSVEFKNRLDKIIYFKNLDKDSLLKIINKLLDELALQLQEKNIYLTLSNSAKEYLLEQSYDPLMGARPLRRTIDELIKKPLSYKILFENLSDKIEVFIDVQNNSLNIQYNST